MIIKIIEKKHNKSLYGIEISGITSSLKDTIQYICKNNVRCDNSSDFIYDFIQHYQDNITIYSFIENASNVINREMMIFDFYDNRIDIYDPMSYPSNVTIPIMQRDKTIEKLQYIYQEDL